MSTVSRAPGWPPSPAPRRQRRGGLIAGITLGAVALVAATVVTTWYVGRPSSAPAAPVAAAASSPTWHSVFGDDTASPGQAATTAPVNLSDPAALAACEAVQAAGADGEYDPIAMLHVAEVGENATDPAIAPSIQALATAAASAKAAPKDLNTILKMGLAAIDLSTACTELRYTKP